MGNSSSHLQPSGLYSSQKAHYDLSIVQKYIREGKLAPFQSESRKETSATEPNRKEISGIECPICFLYYPSLNKTLCCSTDICTECLIYIHPTNTGEDPECPFCLHGNLKVVHIGQSTTLPQPIRTMELFPHFQKYLEAMKEKERIDAEQAQYYFIFTGRRRFRSETRRLERQSLEEENLRYKNL